MFLACLVLISGCLKIQRASQSLRRLSFGRGDAAKKPETEQELGSRPDPEVCVEDEEVQFPGFNLT